MRFSLVCRQYLIPAFRPGTEPYTTDIHNTADRKENPMPSMGDWLAARGCTKTAALVYLQGRLVRKTFSWSASVPLQSGAQFRPSFKARIGVDFEERRSPVEVETLVEAFNSLEAFVAQRPDVFGLPAGYRLTEQDKTDLFYVLGPRGNLAIRELVLPAIENPAPPTTKPPTTQPPTPPPVTKPPTPPPPTPPPVTQPPTIPPPTLPPAVSFGNWLAAQRCTRTAALVGSRLMRKTFTWDPKVPLGSGAQFRPSFKARIGVDYDERRSPIEVETLVEAFNTLEAFLAKKPDVFGLPAGYKLTEQDKTDLFYVLGPLNNLALRELVLPRISAV
jgi:hypothetical protein